MTLMTTTWTTRFIRRDHMCLGVAGPTGLTITAGGHNDTLLWSRNLASGSGQLHSWSPWGNGNSTNGLPGFNGERADPVSGSYHLGNGYRDYNPILKRFNCPDSLSPYGVGGINPYAYCAGDPINHTDQTGHMSWQGIVGIVGGIFGLGLSLFTAGASIAASGSVAAAVSSASTTMLVVGGLGIAGDAVGIASGAAEDVNPAASSVLGWISMASGITGMVAGILLAPKGARTIMQATEGTRQQLRGLLETGLSGRGAPVAAKRLSTANLEELSAIAFQGQISEDKIFFLHKSSVQSNEYFLINSINNNQKVVPDGKYLFVNRTDEPERIRLALDSDVKGHTSVAQYLNYSGNYVPHNVYIAGELYFKKGVISKWNVRSGHYLPDEEFFSRGPINWLNNIMPVHLFDY